MRVISNKALVKFASVHPEANISVQSWRKVIEKNVISNDAEMRKFFSSVDSVCDYHVFNIDGNQYRLITFVNYPAQICYIKHVLTHKEWDKQGAWK